jgi:hypothetical protein
MLELAKLSSVGMVRPAAVREEVDGRREEGEGELEPRVVVAGRPAPRGRGRS